MMNKTFPSGGRNFASIVVCASDLGRPEMMVTAIMTQIMIRRRVGKYISATPHSVGRPRSAEDCHGLIANPERR
jgi:hypothetical protein